MSGNTYYIPHIGYWAAFPEKAHYAYIADPASFFDSTTLNGTSSEKYTGIWECGIVPSPETVREGKINVGVWKDASGVRRNSKYRTTTTSGETTTTTEEIKGGDSTADTVKGKCYGNGTDNAVLAYVIEENSSTYYIETAQMR